MAVAESPSSKAYVVESIDDDHFHWWVIGRTAVSDPYLTIANLPQKRLVEQLAATCHSGGANYLYADGHTKWARFENLWGTTRETNAFWPSGAFSRSVKDIFWRVCLLQIP